MNDEHDVLGNEHNLDTDDVKPMYEEEALPDKRDLWMETNVIKKCSVSDISTESKILARRKSEGVSNMIIEKNILFRGEIHYRREDYKEKCILDGKVICWKDVILR